MKTFFQAVEFYGEASSAALQSPILAISLSPLDGVFVPTFGAFYVGVTLLFPSSFPAGAIRPGRASS